MLGARASRSRGSHAPRDRATDPRASRRRREAPRQAHADPRATPAQHEHPTRQSARRCGSGCVRGRELDHEGAIIGGDHTQAAGDLRRRRALSGPRPEEIDACRPYLWRQIEIIRPKVICTLGNFATKLLSGDQRGITKVHGQPRPTEFGGHKLYLYPIFQPAAALYTPANLATLKEDFLRLPELLAHTAPAPGEEAAQPPAASRPAWRPPEHLGAQQSAASALPSLEDAALLTPDDETATTLESATESTPDDAPAVEPRETVATLASTPEVTAAPAASTPAARPPAEPEQLDLF